MNSYDAAERAGITYRQLDHWTRQGWARPSTPANGSGTQRDYDLGEVAVLASTGDLVKTLGIDPQRAFILARAMSEHGAVSVTGSAFVCLLARWRGELAPEMPLPAVATVPQAPSSPSVDPTTRAAS